jgi:hypothetical protein
MLVVAGLEWMTSIPKEAATSLSDLRSVGRQSSWSTAGSGERRASRFCSCSRSLGSGDHRWPRRRPPADGSCWRAPDRWPASTPVSCAFYQRSSLPNRSAGVFTRRLRARPRHRRPVAQDPGPAPWHGSSLRVLLQPWPLRVQASDLHPVRPVQRLTKDPYGFFEFAPAEGLDLDLLDRVLVRRWPVRSRP